MYVVDCNATAPEFLVQIGGVEFSVSPKDQIIPSRTTSGDVVCFSKVDPEAIGEMKPFFEER